MSEHFVSPPPEPSLTKQSWRTTSEEHTAALGEQIGAALRPGDTLGLVGPLGAGKTRLVHGIVRGIARQYPAQTTPRVCSPSYTIINTYDLGPLRVHHADLYRLRDIDDLESTGYWDAIEDPDAITLVEWLDQVDGAAPPLAAIFTITPDPNTPNSAHTQTRVLTLHLPQEGDLGARLQNALNAFKDVAPKDSEHV